MQQFKLKMQYMGTLLQQERENKNEGVQVMAKQKGKKQKEDPKLKADSPFAKFEVKGDTKEGKFQNFQLTKMGGAVALDNGLIGLGVVLKSYFAPIRKKIHAGDLVKVVFTGKSKRTKLYDVYWKGKKLTEREGGKVGPATDRKST